jgi:hypothetical protein
MYIPISSLITVALTASINASVEVGSESPYGLAFSPTTISASRYNTSSSIEISRFPVGLEYQRYYEDTLRKMRESIPESYSRSTKRENVVTMLRNEVNAVTTRLSGESPHTPGYGSVFLPSIFDMEVQRAAHEATFQDGDKYGLFNYGPSLRTICHGFNLPKCSLVEQIPYGVCNETDYPETVIFTLEYQKDCLHVGFFLTVWEHDLFASMAEETCLICGERYIQVKHIDLTLFI